MDSNHNNGFHPDVDWRQDSDLTEFNPPFSWNALASTIPAGFDFGNQPSTLQSRCGVDLVQPVGNESGSAIAFPTANPTTTFVPAASNLEPNYLVSQPDIQMIDVPPAESFAGPSVNFKVPQNLRRPRYSAEEWEAHRAQIKRLYLDEDKPLDDTMIEMAKLDFNPS